MIDLTFGKIYVILTLESEDRMKKCYECRDFKKNTKSRKDKILLKAYINLPKELCNDCYKYLLENLKLIKKGEIK